MMWGAVTGIGMRWKAFASQDFLAKDENFAAMLIYYNEAQTGLGYILRGFAPEWVSVALFDPQTLAFIKSKEVVRHPDPWGFAKGKGLGRGGGLSFDNEDSSLDVYEKNSQQVESDEWLIPGRRVEICGLLKSPDMNGMKCTLVEEVDDEKWQVRLDGDLGDKLIKVANMKSFHDKPITAEDHSTKEFSLAGTFTEWMPMDMHWDSEAKCHMLEFNIDKLKCPAGFDIAKGKAAPIAWKKRTAQWKITEPGKYQVKSFCKDGGRFQRIDITRVGEVEVPVPEEGLRLREMLRNARPSWTDKELASVQEKLAKVEITTVSDFLEAIKPKKSGGLGDRLKEVGEKAFSGETMKAFREYAKCSV
mmetsp:Transcript_36050/g.67055  ORF Transcript_36050/g.67055 Transcript_36050/m.67055 type:complete len:361 (-) Transcript_36050:133-1215(-)